MKGHGLQVTLDFTAEFIQEAAASMTVAELSCQRIENVNSPGSNAIRRAFLSEAITRYIPHFHGKTLHCYITKSVSGG